MSIGSDAYDRFDKKAKTLSRDDWGFVYADDTLVRYVDYSDPRDCEELLAYIAAMSYPISPYTDGRQIGGSWQLLFVSYEKLPQGDQFRFKHALTPAGASAGTAFVTENNCTFLVTITFYWRQATVATPTAGSSGITYTVGGVTRDTKTGFYSYYIEKREQLVTKIAEHKVAEDVYSTTYERQYLGVRESTAGSGVYTKDQTGNVISGLADWTPDAGTQGTSYTQSLTKNVNCTADITQRKVVAKPNVVGAQTDDKTLFNEVTSTETRGVATADVTPVAASSGKTTAKKSVKADDGTFVNTLTEDQEFTVDEASKEQKSDLAGTDETVENRGKAAAATIPASPTEGTLVEVVNEKTKGGWFTQRIRTFVAAYISNRELRKSKTAFETTTEYKHEAVAAADIPADPPAASGGTWYERFWTKRLDRKYDVREVKHEEAELDGDANPLALHETSKSTFENVETFVQVGSTPLDDAHPPFGGTIFENANELTSGGKFRKTEKQRVENNVPEAVTTTANTLFDTRTVTENKGQSVPMPASAILGVTVTNEKSQYGQYTQHEEVITPKAVSDAVTVETGDFTHTEKRAQDRNQNAASGETAGLTSGGTSAASIKEVVVTRTNEGKYDNDVTELKPEAAWSQVFDLPVSDTKYIKLVIFTNQTSTDLANFIAALGEIGSISCSPSVNKWGLLDGSMQITFEEDSSSSRTPASGTAYRLRRMPNGQMYELTVQWKYAFNVSDGLQNYNAIARYDGSFFKEIGNNWYQYEAVTSMAPQA